MALPSPTKAQLRSPLRTILVLSTVLVILQDYEHIDLHIKKLTSKRLEKENATTSFSPYSNGTTYKNQSLTQQNRQQSTHTPISCKDVHRKLHEQPPLPRSKINALRRLVQQNDPKCFQQLLPIFANDFLTRCPKDKHLNLHVPKSGGTTICKMAYHPTHSNFTPGGQNCWIYNFEPIWCCSQPSVIAPTLSCDELNRPFVRGNRVGYPDFVMNENYMRYPLCEERAYSIVLRDPIDRAISHKDHLEDFIRVGMARGEVNGWRRQIAQSNYVTWSLIAGVLHYPQIQASYFSDDNVTSPFELVPSSENHLYLAKAALLRLDYLIDIFTNSTERETCTKRILHLAGLDSSEEPLPHKNSARSGYESKYRRQDFEAKASLDLLLYEYSQTILSLDCMFFDHVWSLQQSQNSTM